MSCFHKDQFRLKDGKEELNSSDFCCWTLPYIKQDIHHRFIFS